MWLWKVLDDFVVVFLAGFVITTIVGVIGALFFDWRLLANVGYWAIGGGLLIYWWTSSATINSDRASTEEEYRRGYWNGVANALRVEEGNIDWWQSDSERFHRSNP